MVRKRFTAKYKAQVALEAIKNDSTIEQLSQKFGVHPTQIKAWKADFIANSEKVFCKEDHKKEANLRFVAELERKIGQQAVEIDFLKKNYKDYLKRND
jgi:transposase-like protein